jgi:hypothetical protein
MKINRRILKIRSRFYYYLLVIIGSTTVLFLTRCHNSKHQDDIARQNDSIAKAKHQQDSIAIADSIREANKMQAALDSIHLADSITKAKKKIKNKPTPPNPFVPTPQPAVDYGVLPDQHPTTKYGVPFNDFKD